MKESQISNNSNGGYFFLRTNTFVSETNEGQSLLYCATYHKDSLLVYLDYFQHLDLCFVGTNYILNALQQRYKSRTTTELQKYISVNGPNYVEKTPSKNLSNINPLFVVVVDDNSFKLTSPGKVLGRETKFH